MQLTHEQFALAIFLHDVVRADAAFALRNRDEICVIHGSETILPLWSSERAARRVQRRCWSELRTVGVSIAELLAQHLPRARGDGVAIGIGIEPDEGLVTIPAEWLERALRAGIERAWREPKVH